MALVQQLVRLHGGEITVRSAEDTGSTFRVLLPFGSAHLPSDRIAHTGQPRGPSQSAAAFTEECFLWLDVPNVADVSGVPHVANASEPARRDRVLVADDNAELRAYIRRLISRRFDVISVGNGLAALAAAIDQQPDLVLADVMMPGLDGFGLVQELRANPTTSSIPIVLLSARAGEEAKVEGLERGADDYLVKPFGAQELMARVQTHITLARERTARHLLQQSNKNLAQVVEERTTWLALMHEVTRIINEAASLPEALRSILQKICRAQSWHAGYIYLPDPDDPGAIKPIVSHFDERLQPFHVACERVRMSQEDGVPGRVYIEGTAQWLNGQNAWNAMLPVQRATAKAAGINTVFAHPIKSTTDTLGVLELFSKAQRAPDDMLTALLNDVTDQIGKLLERERLTTQIADLVWREQQGLLHTLHDSLGQTLTGLGMLSAGLRQRLNAADPQTAELATHITTQATLALEQVRQLSRGLFPIDVDSEGLPFALRDLASTTENFHKIRVLLSEQITVAISDSRVATQLYRIAQEAVTNAAKHARAHSILIELIASSDVTMLCVRDDGVGPPKALSASSGLGLHIMRYRARSIGAQLSITDAAEGGTIVTCTVPRTYTEGMARHRELNTSESNERG